MIHEETNIVENPIKMKMVEDEEEMDECLYEKFVRRDKDRAHSIIDDIFTGRFKTVYECNGCPKQKRLFEKFSIIYLPIPGGMNVSIDDCLREFERPDHLKEWDCKICKAETPHTKKTTIYRANKILIFCLKRFKSNNQKIQKSINIPFQLSLDGFRAKEQSETLQDS
jgi:ubiquitin C-terminal hydrolase